MQPSSREMQAMSSLLSPSAQLSLHDQEQGSQIQNGVFDPQAPATPHDDFLDQVLSGSWSGVDPTIKASWDTPMPRPIVDESSQSDSMGFHAKMMLQHQQQIMMMPLSLSDHHQNDVVDGSSSSTFKSPSGHHRGGDDPVQALYNGFTAGSLHGGQAQNQPQHFQHTQQGAQNFGAPGTVMIQGQAQSQAQPQASASTSGTAAQPNKPRVRARRGQATDPHSIAERLRRERIAERMKALQELVPNANKTDKASMLDEIIDYVKFLQLQVKVLSMSRLGGAAAVAPLVADMSNSEGGGGRAEGGGAKAGGSHSAAPASDSLTMTEQQVAKLMEEDMGSAMQYLQGKGLCLMPISLATAISTATSHSGRNPLFPRSNGAGPAALQSNGAGDGPSSPNMSALTVQSAAAAMGSGNPEASIKDTNSVSKS